MESEIIIPVYMRIRNYIASTKGLNLRIVADKAGFSRSRFYRIMSGASLLLADEVEEICVKGLGLHPGVFFEEKLLKSKN